MHVRRIAEAGSESFVLKSDGEATAQISFPDRTIRILELAEGMGGDFVEHFLVDQVVPRILAHEGALVCHAGSILIDGRIAAFVGPSGCGKSTLVGALADDDWHLTGDDVLVFDAENEPLRAHSLYRRLRLLPDSAAELFPDHRPASVTRDDVGPPGHKTRITPAGSLSEENRPYPVSVLVFLERPTGDTRVTARPLAPAEACMTLVSNSFSLYPLDPEDGANRMRIASRVAQALPAVSIHYPRDYARIAEVKSAVREILSAHAVPLSS